ncbi:germ cell nuclear acidic protein isoform X2 [Boleophthalmus pectinirostris]|uniref:germ cell nuclear acidic protein isoform X2 n=1 Tax=Boleophthalmus pectinirostris TaxID=150288 RepID=UPI00242FAF71|nr:germ cell nuclear acidic protein isoform X2 [Boleophthalmus pectinirostris]
MDDDTHKLFDKVAKNMGWMEIGLDVAVENLRRCVGKSRHLGTSYAKNGSSGASGSDGDADKENLPFESKDYRVKSLNDSTDDEFDQFLKKMATPKTKTQTPSQKPVPVSKKESIVVVSSDSDGSFETFLSRVKTPNVKPRTIKKSDGENSLKNFIVNDSSSDDDFIDPKSIRVPKKMHTPSQALLRRPLSQCESPVFISDSDDDEDNIVIKSTWKTRYKRLQPSNKENSTTLQGDGDCSPSVAAKPSPLSFFSSKVVNSLASEVYSSVPKQTFSAPSRLAESSSSEEEFTSLLDRLKKKNKLPGGTPSPAPRKELKTPIATPNPVNGPKSSKSKLIDDIALNCITPSKNIIVKPTVSQTEPRHGPSSRVALCKTPGCFLETLSNPGTTYGHNFKQNKEELTSRLFKLYNASVFDGKLPASMPVTWNKKMRKTAGYCITGQERGGGNRYARIELSEKVCDSADRLRDTLIHEMCHAATWLINGVRDGHGNFWKLYARKSTVIHPELPMVTRCHSYDIKYKFQYQCTRCQNTIGRHSKSLDTERFVCALCTGKLVLLNPSKPRTPTPFANFVKENYGAVRQELVGQSHAEVMRKLSADFALKTKLSQS